MQLKSKSNHYPNFFIQYQNKWVQKCKQSEHQLRRNRRCWTGVLHWRQQHQFNDETQTKWQTKTRYNLFFEIPSLEKMNKKRRLMTTPNKSPSNICKCALIKLSVDHSWRIEPITSMDKYYRQRFAKTRAEKKRKNGWLNDNTDPELTNYSTWFN